ncbi:MAG: DNA polymerase [Methanogenium sp.]
MNLQQIPRTKEYRSCFISDNDYLLSCADYSNQESRIMADFSNDESYIQYFKDGNDPHSFVATKMFSASFKKEFIVTSTNENKEYRQKGKTLNFGISFGMSAFTLSKRLHISDKEAQQLIDLFYSNFPKLETLFASARQFGIDNGYIRTNSIINRIRWFPEWNDLNKYKNDRSKYAKIKGSIERKSQNTIIQGSASDMTKIALIKLRDVLLSDGIRPLQNASVKLISVVHDETIIEAKKDIIEYYSNIQKECMEKAGEVICKKVKIKAEPMITPFWKH